MGSRQASLVVQTLPLNAGFGGGRFGDLRPVLAASLDCQLGRLANGVDHPSDRQQRDGLREGEPHAHLVHQQLRRRLRGLHRR